MRVGFWDVELGFWRDSAGILPGFLGFSEDFDRASAARWDRRTCVEPLRSGGRCYFAIRAFPRELRRKFSRHHANVLVGIVIRQYIGIWFGLS